LIISRGKEFSIFSEILEMVWAEKRNKLDSIIEIQPFDEKS
jgi:hypothetical protein